MNGQPNMVELAKRLRDQATAVDPEAAICSEELWNFEVDSDYLDYTWNWGGFRDCQAFTGVFPSPRISCIVTAAPAGPGGPPGPRPAPL